MKFKMILIFFLLKMYKFELSYFCYRFQIRVFQVEHPDA